MPEFRILPHIYKWIEENMKENEAEILNDILKISNDTVREKIDHSARVGMSSLGAECIRSKYYDLIDAKKDEAKANFTSVLRLNIGHYYHRLFQYICKQIWQENCFIEETCYLYDEDNNVIAESEVDIRLDIDGKSYVYDIKSINEQGFYNALGGKISKKYIFQGNSYYEATNCDHFNFLFININTCDMFELPLERDVITGMIVKDTAKKLNECVKAKTPPEIPYSTYADCIRGDGKYCKYINQDWDSSNIKEYEKEIIKKDIAKPPKGVMKSYKKDMEKLDKVKEKIKKINEKRDIELQKYKDEEKEIKTKWVRYAYAQKKTIVDMGEDADKIIYLKKEKKYKLDERKLIAEMGDKLRDYYIEEEKTSPKHLKRIKKNFNLKEGVDIL